MKKLCSIFLLFSILITLFSGCSSKTDIKEYYNKDVLSEEERTALISKYKSGFGIYHWDSDIDSEIYMEHYRKVDKWGVIERILSLEEMALFVTDYYEDITEADDEEDMEILLSKTSFVLEAIKTKNISKEDFIKANDLEKAENPEKGEYFTDKEIKILYSGDENKIKEYFVGDYGIYHNGKIYTVHFLYKTSPERWKEEGVPVKKLKKLFKKLEEEDTERYIDSAPWFHSGNQEKILETYSLILKLEEYKALIK